MLRPLFQVSEILKAIALGLTGLLNRCFGNAFDVLPLPTLSIRAL